MTTDPTLLVIAEPTDELAARLVARAGSPGRRVEHVDFRQATGRLSVAQDERGVRVRPGCPIFLRAPAAPPAGASQLTAFHHAEIRGLVWAAASLTPAPVVNRPTGDGFVGRFVSAGAVLRQRVGLPARGEVFVSHASALGAPAEETDWWFEHRSTFATAQAAAVGRDRGPYRVGRIPEGCEPALVCVAGDLAVDIGSGESSTGSGESSTGTGGSSTGSDRPVLTASLGVAAALRLRFATLAWRRTPAGLVELGRVNPYPTPTELGGQLERVLDALIAQLCPC